MLYGPTRTHVRDTRQPYSSFFNFSLLFEKSKFAATRNLSLYPRLCQSVRVTIAAIVIIIVIVSLSSLSSSSSRLVLNMSSISIINCQSACLKKCKRGEAPKGGDAVAVSQTRGIPINFLFFLFFLSITGYCGCGVALVRDLR